MIEAHESIDTLSTVPSHLSHRTQQITAWILMHAAVVIGCADWRFGSHVASSDNCSAEPPQARYSQEKVETGQNQKAAFDALEALMEKLDSKKCLELLQTFPPGGKHNARDIIRSIDAMQEEDQKHALTIVRHIAQGGSGKDIEEHAINVVGEKFPLLQKFFAFIRKGDANPSRRTSDSLMAIYVLESLGKIDHAESIRMRVDALTRPDDQ